MQDTLSTDGDPLDAMICVSEPTFPGCIVHARPIALLEMEDEKGPDPHLLCVPCDDPGGPAIAARRESARPIPRARAGPRRDRASP